MPGEYHTEEPSADASRAATDPPETSVDGGRRALAAEIGALRAREAAARQEGDAALARVAELEERLSGLEELKEHFLTLVSYELRTPLTSIIGYVQLLLEEADDELPDLRGRFLGIVERNALRLLRLVNDMLFVVQVDSGLLSFARDEIDLAKLARRVVAEWVVVAEERDLTLVFEGTTPVPVRGDSEHLGKAIENLVSNALKFTPEGGQVEVRAFRWDAGATVEVADTGIGIAPDEQPRLFERFFRGTGGSTGSAPGSGLGLAVAKAIVEAHGGQISFETEADEGTTFRIVL